MRRSGLVGLLAITSIIGFAYSTISFASGNGDHAHTDTVETMREMHNEHEHAHDFEVMDEMTAEQRERLDTFMVSVGIAMPPMDSRAGRRLFLERGCIVCHAVNGIGGEIGPSLDAGDMPSPMNAFEFAARMWRGAPAMVAMQEQMLGEFIDLTGNELADLIAFVHDENEQSGLTKDEIPKRFRELIPQ